MPRLTVQEIEEATKKIAENVEKIGELIKESQELSRKTGIEFSLEEFDFLTTDQLYNRGWTDSNC